MPQPPLQSPHEGSQEFQPHSSLPFPFMSATPLPFMSAIDISSPKPLPLPPISSPEPLPLPPFAPCTATILSTLISDGVGFQFSSHCARLVQSGASFSSFLSLCSVQLKLTQPCVA